MSRKIVVGDCFEFEGNTYVLDLVDGEPPWGYRTFPNGWQRVLFWYAGRNTLVPTLHLPISEPWFSRILSGEKTEEYREIEGREGTFRNCSLIWGVSAKCAMDVYDSANHVREMSFAQWMNEQNKKDFKVLHLTNGYGHHRPQLWAHIEEVTIGKGNPEWGAPVHEVFIIKLGEVFHTKNLKPIPVSQ